MKNFNIKIKILYIPLKKSNTIMTLSLLIHIKSFLKARDEEMVKYRYNHTL